MSNQMGKKKPSLRQTMAAQAAQAAEHEERRQARRRRVALVAAGVLGGVVLVGAIVAAVVLSRPGEEARELNPTAQRLGCISCHTIDGRRSEGPTWDGLWGSEVVLADGSTDVVDDDYLRRAILEPNAQVAAGYPAAMPTIAVTDAELEELVDHIRSLGVDP